MQALAGLGEALVLATATKARSCLTFMTGYFCFVKVINR
jgi:hypothetical protein